MYLTETPNYIFKVVYRRHTNFAIESIKQLFLGNQDFGSQIHCNINMVT